MIEALKNSLDPNKKSVMNFVQDNIRGNKQDKRELNEVKKKL